MLLRLVGLPLLLAAAIVQAQESVPGRRAHHSLVYDDGSKRVILAGGSTPIEGGRTFTLFNDVWAFDGTRWTSLGAAGPGFSGAAVAWDSRQQRIVSFGVYDGRGSSGALRVLQGSAWNTVGEHPSIRAAEPGFVYDTRRDRFIAFGGSAGRGTALGETWALSGTTWSKVDVPGPPARQAHAMVFDAKRNVVVVFGGMGTGAPGQPPPLFGDTWEFDGTTWTQKQVTGPAARNSAGATFDSKRGVVVLFGGSGPDGFFGDTWSWDGTAWRKLAATGPEARVMGYMAYDRNRDRVVLFGGRKGWPDGDLNDTWEWDGNSWRRVTTQH